MNSIALAKSSALQHRLCWILTPTHPSPSHRINPCPSSADGFFQCDFNFRPHQFATTLVYEPRTSGSFAGEKLMLLSCHDIYSTMASIAWHQIYQQPHYHATTPSVMPRHSLLNASSYGKVAPSAHSPASLDKRWGSHANLAIASIDKGRHHPCSDEKTDSFPSYQMSRTKGQSQRTRGNLMFPWRSLNSQRCNQCCSHIRISHCIKVLITGFP